MSRADAERRLTHVLADIDRGQWQPPAPPAPAQPEMPYFHELAETWWKLSKHEWLPATGRDYRWKLEQHVIPAFGEQLVDAGLILVLVRD